MKCIPLWIIKTPFETGPVISDWLPWHLRILVKVRNIRSETPHIIGALADAPHALLPMQSADVYSIFFCVLRCASVYPYMAGETTCLFPIASCSSVISHLNDVHPILIHWITSMLDNAKDTQKILTYSVKRNPIRVCLLSALYAQLSPALHTSLG